MKSSSLGCARTTSSPRSTNSSTATAPTTWRRSTRSRASAAIHTRTISPTACCAPAIRRSSRSEEHTSELQSQSNLGCRLLLEKKKDISTVFRVWIKVLSGLDKREVFGAELLLQSIDLFGQLLFFFSFYRHNRLLPSFPTRRSSD